MLDMRFAFRFVLLGSSNNNNCRVTMPQFAILSFMISFIPKLHTQVDNRIVGLMCHELMRIHSWVVIEEDHV